MTCEVAPPDQPRIPLGWARLSPDAVTPELTGFAVAVLDSDAPIGTLVEWTDTIAGWVEYHCDETRGWHRGVSLLERSALVPWTDPVLGALPEWLREQLGVTTPTAPPPVPPPNLPGYAPLPGIGGGWQGPPAPSPLSGPPSPAPDDRSWAPLVIAGAATVALVGVVSVWRR